MATSKVTVKMNGAATRALCEAMAESGANAAREYVRQNIRALGRVDTGRMLRTIYVQRLSSTNDSATFEVASDLFYTVYQERGTGVYAGKGPITPKRAKSLRFKPKGSNTYVFAKQVRGVPAGRFFERAVKMVRPSDFKA